MKSLFTVASFTFKDMLQRKSFIISNIIIFIIIIIGFNIPNLIKMITDDSEFFESKLLVVDSSNVFEGSLTQLSELENVTYEFIYDNTATYEQIKGKIDAGEIEAALLITPENDSIHINYIVENMSMMYGVPEECISAVSTIYTNLQISKLNLSEEQLASLAPNFEFELSQTSDKEVLGNVYAIMLLSLVLFYSIYFCAYQVSTSITTEKTSKIMETLVTSTTPKTIVLGKTVGVGLVGLIQIIAIVTVSLICANLCLDPEILNSIVDLSSFTPFLAVITLVYFILGYSLYSLCYALTGSTVSKPEDVQSANGPVAILAVIGFYLAYFTMMNPTSDLNVFASIFPLSAPFCMPFRVMMGVASSTEIISSILIMVVTIIIVAKISIKIYSQAILNYGSKLNLKDLITMYKEKN